MLPKIVINNVSIKQIKYSQYSIFNLHTTLLDLRTLTRGNERRLQKMKFLKAKENVSLLDKTRNVGIRVNLKKTQSLKDLVSRISRMCNELLSERKRIDFLSECYVTDLKVTDIKTIIVR